MNQLAIGMPGGTEWLIIFAVLLLVFGGKKLPELARAMGRSITEFKGGLKGDPELPPTGSGGKAGSGPSEGTRGGSKTEDEDRS